MENPVAGSLATAVDWKSPIFLLLFLFLSFLFGGGIGFKMTRSRRTTRARGTGRVAMRAPRRDFHTEAGGW